MTLEERRERADQRRAGVKGLETSPLVREEVEVFDGRVESLPSPVGPGVPEVAEDQRVRLVTALERHGVDEEMLVRVCRDATGATMTRRASGPEGTYYEEVPDHSVILKGAAELKGYLQLAGRMAAEVREEDRGRPTVLMVRIESDGTRTAIEMRG